MRFPALQQLTIEMQFHSHEVQDGFWVTWRILIQKLFNCPVRLLDGVHGIFAGKQELAMADAGVGDLSGF
jgi:hypothetical protein